MSNNNDWDDARKEKEAARYGEPQGDKDQKGWLKVFGGLMVFVGLLFLLAVYGILSEGMNPTLTEDGSVPLSMGSAIAMAFMLALPTMLNIVLGWGSITTKRWARALVRIVSGSMLIFLLFALAGMLVAMTATPEAMGSSGEEAVGLVFAVVMFGVLFVFPNVLIYWFYGRPDTIATVEKHDPVIRWTDKKPLLIIGIALFSALGTIGSFMGIIATMFLPTNMIFPAIYFGIVVSGFAGNLTNLAIFGLYAYYTWLFWKLDPRGWWGLLALAIFYMISTFVTQMVLSPMEMISATSGLDPVNMSMESAALQEAEAMFQVMGVFNLLMLAIYGWLFWKVRGYFGMGKAEA